MAMTRPEARETTGTLRETSGATVPVTTNSEAVGCWAAAASGNCSGWSTGNSAASGNGTTLGLGGATILEPSFGDGSFLVPLIERLVELQSGSPRERYVAVMEQNLYGVELDEIGRASCRPRV